MDIDRTLQASSTLDGSGYSCTDSYYMKVIFRSLLKYNELLVSIAHGM